MENLPDLQLTEDAVESLTIRELNLINTKLGEDAIEAITTPTAARWNALALVGWVLAKRQDPSIKLSVFEDLTITQLTRLLTAPAVAESADVAEGAPEPPRSMEKIAKDASANPTGRSASR